MPPLFPAEEISVQSHTLTGCALPTIVEVPV